MNIKYICSVSALVLAICLVHITVGAAGSADVLGKRDVLSYFRQAYPQDSDLVKGLKFQEKDIPNGYLVVTGEMEGHIVFALFKGDKQDVLVEQGTGCGPECEQAFRTHIFRDGKLVKSATGEDFESLYPQKTVDAHLTAFIKKVRKLKHEPAVSWLRLPRQGRVIDVLVVAQPIGTADNDANVYRAGQLTWNGTKFDFKKMEFAKPSEIFVREIY